MEEEHSEWAYAFARPLAVLLLHFFEEDFWVSALKRIFGYQLVISLQVLNISNYERGKPIFRHIYLLLPISLDNDLSGNFTRARALVKGSSGAPGVK